MAKTRRFALLLMLGAMGCGCSGAEVAVTESGAAGERSDGRAVAGVSARLATAQTVGSAPIPTVGPSATSSSTATVVGASAAPTVEHSCQELEQALTGTDVAIVRQAAIEVSQRACPETSYELAVKKMRGLVKTLAKDDDSLFRAAEAICARTRHPAVQKEAAGVYYEHLVVGGFPDDIKQRVLDKRRGGRDC